MNYLKNQTDGESRTEVIVKNLVKNLKMCDTIKTAMDFSRENLEDIGCLVDMHKKAVVGVIHRCIYNEEERRELLLRKLAIILVLFSGIFFMNAAFSREGQGVDEGDCYYDLLVDASDIDSAIATCADEFAKGNARSGYWLGAYYGDDKNMPEKALFYIKKSAEMGDAPSLLLIGMAHTDGKWIEFGLSKDIDKGLSYIKKAADKELAGAQFVYAHFYDNVREVTPNITLAWDYYNKAAENGELSAMVKLGAFYLYRGISGDCKKENNWSMEGMSRIREKYASLNIVCDRAKGLSYFENAAKMGHVTSQFVLGEYYYEEKNWAQSKYWFSLLLEWERPLGFFSNRNNDHNDELKNQAKQYIKKIPTSTVVTVEDNLYERYLQEACQYKAHSWYYKCHKKGDK